MADKITETKTLNIGVEYTDGDNVIKTAYIKILNPKNNLTEQTIRDNTGQLIADVLIDPTGAQMSDTQIATAYTEYTKKTELDLGYA